jgi:hypothetical protein
LKKESAIRQACTYQNEFALSIDFLLLFTRMIKKSVMHEIEIGDELIDYMAGVEDIAITFARVCLLDASMLKYKPSVAAASYVFIGILL